VACPGLTALEAPGSSAAEPQRAVVAVRVATPAERRLVLGDKHTGGVSVAPGALLTPCGLASLLRAATDGE